jgi:hypothetical protein
MKYKLFLGRGEQERPRQEHCRGLFAYPRRTYAKFLGTVGRFAMMFMVAMWPLVRALVVAMFLEHFLLELPEFFLLFLGEDLVQAVDPLDAVVEEGLLRGKDFTLGFRDLGFITAV